MTRYSWQFAARRRRYPRRRRGAWLTILGLLLLLAAVIGAADFTAVWRALAQTRMELSALAAAVGAVLLVGALFSTGFPTLAWHGFANALAERKARPIKAPRVIDGDTLDDLATGTRYRLANIDAPETGDKAKCHRERERGEEAAATAAYLVVKAGTVTVRRTFRVDRYGRSIAFVLVDGVDLGELLVARGLARPWRGQRRRWCGPKGGLAAIARTGHAPHVCATCRAWN